MPRFVVLEHDWNGVHWDLMIEVGTAFRTWRLEAPIVAGADVPAIRLADHRLDYWDYEGPVSGDRGTVRRLDRGRHEVREWTADLIRVGLVGAQLVGEAELRRKGEIETPPRDRWIFRLAKVE